MTSAGATWTYASQGLNKLDVLCIELDPAQPGVLYLGVTSGGVYRSVDGGLTWSSFGLGLSTASVFDILLKGSIYAAANSGFINITLRSDLAVSLEHAGDFLSGGLGQFTVRVTNAGLARRR
jgi:hypothetical protein